MKIIISPAKKMNIQKELLEYHSLPIYIKQTEELKNKLVNMSLDKLQELWKCNDKIAQLNYERLQSMKLRENLTPAILSYEGIQYQYMAPTIFESHMLDYVQKHLRILSGFYGVLKPMDGVTPYRLEMQAKLAMDTSKNLYEYWGEGLYQEVLGRNASEVIINLASKEYSSCVEKYLKPEDRYITCIFGEVVNDKVVQKGTFAKMARGEMVRYMAEHQIEEAESMKGFNRLGYAYDQERSSSSTYVFIKQK